MANWRGGITNASQLTETLCVFNSMVQNFGRTFIAYQKSMVMHTKHWLTSISIANKTNIELSAPITQESHQAPITIMTVNFALTMNAQPIKPAIARCETHLDQTSW